MKYMETMLLDVIHKGGGRRDFPKSGDGLMLAILARMARRGELVWLGETDDALCYGLPQEPPVETD